MADFGFYVVPSKTMELVADRFLILVNDIMVHSYNDTTRRRPTTSSKKLYVKGALLIEQMIVNSSTEMISSDKILCRSSEDPKNMFQCKMQDVKIISQEVYELLLAIPSCTERFDIYQDQNRLADGLDMNVGSEVFVKTPSSTNVHGLIKYKGNIAEKAGTHFGIELSDLRQGNCDGSFNKHKYFQCRENGGVFAPLNRVRPARLSGSRKSKSLPKRSVKSNSLSSQRRSHVSDSGPLRHTYGITLDELQNLSVQLQSRVLIFTEYNGKESEEQGVVKFIGRLPGDNQSADIYVGIELDRPAGNGTGLFNGKHLFYTRQSYAALVPLSGVYPLDLTPSTPIEQKRTPSKKSLYESRSYDFQISKEHDLQRQQSSGCETDEEDIDLYGGEDDLPSTSTSSRNDVYPGLRERAFLDNKNAAPRSFPICSPRREANVPTSLPVPRTNQQKWDQLAGQDVALEDDITDYRGFDIGTMVELKRQNTLQQEPIYGVIKWIGRLPNKSFLVAGIELEDFAQDGTNGSYNGRKYFDCAPGKGIFDYLKDCLKDRRFEPQEMAYPELFRMTSKDFGDFECPKIPGQVAPPSRLSNKMIGKGKGIQGHHNSCYLDSTLFSLFAYSHVLDTLLFRPRKDGDLPEYDDAQAILKEEIINPLRKKNFVRADKILNLREMLDKLGSVSGLVGEEKDPEEFLSTLMNQVLKADPLIELRHADSNQCSHNICYQIFVEKDLEMSVPTTQNLLQNSLVAAGLKFTETPVCLILQMPRFGKDYKMYSKVRPSLELDVTDMVEMLPRSCDSCECVAEYECKDCFFDSGKRKGDTMFTFCEECVLKYHTHQRRRNHNYRKVNLDPDFVNYWHEMKKDGQEIIIEREKLELFAVVCIATSHYVSFARCGTKNDAKWCFFDSMADRVGEQMGYNVPEVTHCPQFEQWLQMDEHEIKNFDERDMPEHMRRVLCDAYMCLYESPELMYYK